MASIHASKTHTESALQPSLDLFPQPPSPLLQLRPAALFDIKRWLKSRYDRLSVRARNCIPGADIPENAVKLAFTHDGDLKLLSIKNCGAKTLIELKDFFSDFNQRLEQLIAEQSQISDDECNADEHLTYELLEQYSFLSLEECREIAEFTNRTGNLPFLQIIHRYIEARTVSDRNIEIIVRKYALDGRENADSMDKLAYCYGMTRERVRQIISKGIHLPEQLSREMETHVVSRLSLINSFDEPFWQELSERFTIRSTTNEVAKLVGAVLTGYAIVQLEPGDTEYLVKRELLKNSTLKTAFSKLKLALVPGRTGNTEFRILDYMVDPKKKYHPEYTRLAVIIASYVRRNLGLEVFDNNLILATANKIDNFEAMENVLLSHGRPMTAEHMWREFRRMYPDAGVKKYTSFKAYLVMNPRILARGKTGTYVHCDWDQYFIGSISDFVAHIIISRHSRVPITELCQLIGDEYGEISRNNLVSTLRLVQSYEYVIYDDDTVGIRGVDTDNAGVNERPVTHRVPFEQRLQLLQNFIDDFDRLPYSSDDDAESTLSRWIYNMSHHKIDATPEEYNMFTEFMARHSSLPQTRIEYKFREKCNFIIARLDPATAILNSLTSKERQWIRKSLKDRKNFAETDQRCRYIDELEVHLDKVGYKI